MPKYNLLCTRDHKFEGWFASEKSYLDQKTKKLIACPICDNTGIRRAVMAPNVNVKSKKIKSKKSKNKKNNHKENKLFNYFLVPRSFLKTST